MTSVAAAAPEYSRPKAPSRPRAGWAIEVAETLPEVETAWRDLERRAVASPYSRYDWVDAYARAGAGAGPVKAALVRDAADRPSLVLPLEVTRRLGVRIATTVGGRHANLGMPIAGGDLAALSPEDARGLLREIGRRLAVDVLALGHVPAAWEGEPNPFAAGARPSASPAYRLDLAADAEATFGRSMTGDARKKLRSKERGLAKLGRVALLEARDEREADLILSAFYRQKEDRFRELGIADPFAGAAVQAFIRNGAVRRRAGDAPAIELYGLTLDGEVIAAFGGAASTERLSGMFLSFAPGEAARFSPGDLLVTRIIARQCERGRRIFDLGVGDARYKRQICDSVEPLVDVLVPVTATGHLYAAAWGAAMQAKRRLKADPRVVAALAAVRKRLASFRG